MSQVVMRSFAKINLGLRIGARREDGFHGLHTVYQTIALHDTVRIEFGRGTGIELRSKTEGVPLDEANTCYRMAERVLRCAKARGKVTIQIEKNLPVQGGLGAASSNAAAVMIGLERLLKCEIPCEKKLEMAAEVGSDVPLFLVGGTVLGLGRGEQVYPLEDLPAMECVIAAPKIGVSTPKAFADWDRLHGDDDPQPGTAVPHKHGRSQRLESTGKLTEHGESDRIKEFSRAIFTALCRADHPTQRKSGAVRGPRSHAASSGVSSKGTAPSRAKAARAGDPKRNRAEPPLFDLVRAGIENDFERVVFPQHPELREVKRVLEREGAAYASLSGSGSSLYGLFGSKTAAVKAARALERHGTRAEATRTLTRSEYWKKVFK
jgi:4-diphosphocytidyl-2-C-methyl-D-erythritol kinase